MTARLDSTRRFSGRVDDYRRARPAYPHALYEELLAQLPPTASAIAELGSGTGIFSGELLRHGYRVYGVEPNKLMRAAAELALSEWPRFESVIGSAEDTTLMPKSVDLVVSAQAFHWFDFGRTQAEVQRILRPGGVVAWAWNSRRTAGSAFGEALERFLERWGTDYRSVRDSYRVRDRLAEFLPERPLHRAAFENHQILDRDNFRARILSASYMPATGQASHDEMVSALDLLFDRHQEREHVCVELDAELFWSTRN